MLLFEATMRWLCVALVILAACAGGAEEEEGGAKGDRPSAPATVVEIEAAAQGGVSDLLVTTAVVESEAQADLVPQAPGIVLSVHKEEGDVVRKGDLLAVLDNVSLDASAERTAAEVARLERDALTARDLHGTGAISDAELADAEHALKAARTSAREASRTFGQTRMTAPFAGVVAQRDVRVGEYVTGATAAFQVVDLDRLRVIAALPERDLGRVAVGQVARLVAAYDPSRTSTGRIARVAPVVQAGSGTFRVTIGVDADQTALRPGQFVSIEIEVDRHEDVIVVARKAVVYEDGLPVVYRMVPAPPPKPDEEAEEVAEGPAMPSWWPFGKEGEEDADEKEAGPQFVAARSAVKLGLVDADRAEILEGIAVGDSVIVLGQSNLRDQAPVQTPAMLAEEREKEAAEKEAEKKAATSSASGDEG